MGHFIFISDSLLADSPSKMKHIYQMYLNVICAGWLMAGCDGVVMSWWLYLSLIVPCLLPPHTTRHSRPSFRHKCRGPIIVTKHVHK